MAGLEPDARTLVAIFRKHMPGGPKSADYLQPDPDILCARLEDLLMDICRIQRRKTGKLLQTCIKEAWALSHGEVKTFAQTRLSKARRTSKTCLQSKSPSSTRSLAWTLSQSWQHPAVPSWSPLRFAAPKKFSQARRRQHPRCQLQAVHLFARRGPRSTLS